MKKFEKPETPNYREYLDMDTDEEEFGIQETPEPEEEEEVEPEKPVFTDDEINTLIQYVKDFTTLPRLTDAVWSREVTDLVEEYFRSPANTVLTIFWDKTTLRALLDFPVFIDEGFTYFLRSPWQVYTPDNFLSTIIFGTIDDEVENSTLKFMENMYAPTAFHTNEWPAVMRNEILSNLHEFLLCLTDATYNPMGLTILYVPREGLQDNKPSVQKDDEVESPRDVEKLTRRPREDEEEGLIERLERVARYWVKQIREAIKGTSFSIESSPCKTIVDEISYWNYRFENLSCVHLQLTNEHVLSIVRKLESARSASVKQYNALMAEVSRKLDEATSNITYLNLLEDFSKGFNIPNGLEDYTTRILLLIRFIGMESPFYNTQERIETLSRAFCTQAVEHCQKYIDLDIVLDGDVNTGREMLVTCLECCKQIDKIYDRLCDMDASTDSPTIALTDKLKVFNHMDTFVQRCNDLIEIADARIAFDKCDDTLKIGGPKGPELSLHYEKIENRFQVILSEIKDVRDYILDMVSAAWLNHIETFKEGINEIESMVKNWIDNIFEDVLNVEEGIEALYGIKRFSRRPYLKETLNINWIKVWKIFGEELESCSLIMNDDSGMIHHPSLPPYSGFATMIRSNKNYLAWLHDMLIDTSDWFDDCDIQENLIQKYKSVIITLTEKENELHSKWIKQLADRKINPESLAQRPIFKYHDDKNDRSVQVNLEIYYLDNFREISEWSQMGFDTKNIFPKDVQKWQTLRPRYNKVDALSNMYNSIIVTATDSENSLFITLIDDFKDMVKPAFKQVHWYSDSLDRFFTDCVGILKNIKESFENYNKIKCKIDALLMNIQKINLVNPKKRLEDLLDGSMYYLEQQRQCGVESLKNICEVIFQSVLDLKSTINTDHEQTADYWKSYVKEIYKTMIKSITSCMQLSLDSALKFVYGSGLTDSPQVIEMMANKAKVKEIQDAIGRINILTIKQLLPADKFEEVFNEIGNLNEFLDEIVQDPKSMDFKQRIHEFFHIEIHRVIG